MKRWPLEVAVLMVGMVLLSSFDTNDIPNDPVASACQIPANEFNSWFESGSVTLNGVVNPADSLGFSDDPNCDFYKWSVQMYLWLTSPAPRLYGGNGIIFNSPVFYDVSPPDANGDRTLIRHKRGLPRKFSVRIAQKGAHNLPVVIDAKGRMLEVLPAKLGPTGRPLLLNDQGKEVEIRSLRIERFAKDTGPLPLFAGERMNAKPVFLDKGGKPILKFRPIFPKELKNEAVVQRFKLGKFSLFLDQFGNAIEVEQGQAGDFAVLESTTNSLVYYTTMVNDVYAYFLTAAKNGDLTFSDHFPRSAAEMQEVIDFAANHNKTFPDPEAMAVEIKASWVEASTLPSTSGYITMTADVPKYVKTDPDNLWTQFGTRSNVKLAMVGIHVVGSTAGPNGSPGHPEMIWASFEHQSNMPNDTFTYINANGQTQSRQDVAGGDWLFCAPSATAFNEEHMLFHPGTSTTSANIQSINPPFTISPSDTKRMNAWGAAPGESPNPIPIPPPPTLAPSVASSNTDIISINNSFHTQLAGGDVRGNYNFLGATWTINGAPPQGPFGEGGLANEVGTSRLSNGTMETYQQRLPNSPGSLGSNCFSCHRSDSSVNTPYCTVDVSHIYWTPFTNHQHGLKPLF